MTHHRLSQRRLPLSPIESAKLAALFVNAILKRRIEGTQR